MEFRLLGTLEARDGEGPVALGRPKQRALLALLLLHANRVVARERLIDELWGEEPPGRAVKAVQTYVSQLRKVLPDGTLVTQPPGYMLRAPAESVDLLRFERLVADARGAEPVRTSALLGEALALWRGPPLAEFAEEPFARAEAGRLDQLRLAALEERIEADLALGRHGELVGELEQAVTAEPQRERLRGQLMLALYRSGRQTEALAAYRDARAALDELGLEPGLALRQLEKQILTQESGLELEGPRSPGTLRAPLPGALAPASPFPFVGRAAELARLSALLEQAEAGQGAIAVIAGDAGSGKTRLVRELAHEAAARGVLVLYGTSDAAVSTPYQPLREWLEFALRAVDAEALRESLGEAGGALARLVPELGRVAGTPLDREPDRDLLQTAARTLIARLSRTRTVLLVADDLHWADAETLQLLRHLARAAPESRLLVVASFRDRGEGVRPELADALAELARLEGVERLSLHNLSPEDVAAFVRASTEADATPELASAMGELTSGTPLLVCELWRELRDTGAVEVTDGAARLSGSLTELRGADRLRDLVRQRLLRLAPETVGLLELAAVAGPRFGLRVLADAAAIEPATLVPRVEEAIELGIVEELPDPPGSCRFTHELVRRAVHDRIAGVRRAELHLRVGEALERVHAADDDLVLPELAHHFTLAAPVGGAERAVDYNLRAAQAAMTAAAYDDAAARLAAALELGIADPHERARTQVELAFLLHELGRIEEEDRTLAASLAAATGLEERGTVARGLILRMRGMADPRADPASMRAVAEEALEIFRRLGDERGQALAGRQLGLAFMREGRTVECCAAYETALVHAQACRDQDTCRRVAGGLVYALFLGPVPVVDAMRRCEELRAVARNDDVLQAIIDRIVGGLLANAGRFDDAREHLDRSSVVLDGLNYGTPSFTYRSVAAATRVLLGDRAGAERDLEARWRWFRELGDFTPNAIAMQSAYMLARLYCDDGRWDDAEHCLAFGSDVPAPEHFLVETVLGLTARARVAAHRGALADALALAERAVELARRGDMVHHEAAAWLALAEVQRANGEPSHDATAAALRIYEAKGNLTAAAALRAVT